MKNLGRVIAMIIFASSPLLAEEDDRTYVDQVEQERIALQQLQQSLAAQQQQEQRRIELAPERAEPTEQVPDHFYSIPGNYLGSGNFYFDSLNLNQPLEATIIPRAGSNPVRTERDIDRSSYSQLPAQYEKY